MMVRLGKRDTIVLTCPCEPGKHHVVRPHLREVFKNEDAVLRFHFYTNSFYRLMNFFLNISCASLKGINVEQVLLTEH